MGRHAVVGVRGVSLECAYVVWFCFAFGGVGWETLHGKGKVATSCAG